MRKSRFSGSQIVAILKEGESGLPIAEQLRKHGISNATYSLWRSKYGGATVKGLARLKALESENAKLKRMYADLALENAAIKDVLPENCSVVREHLQRADIPMILRTSIVALSLACLSVPVARAQVETPFRHRSVQQLVSSVRSGASRGDASIAVLAQAYRDESRERIDSLAQRLVDLAVAEPQSAAVVIGTFVSASRATKRRPYASSFDRLVEVFERARDPGTRGGVLGALGRIGPRSRAISMWRDVATLKEPDPDFGAGPIIAVGLLCSSGGPEGRQLLRRLFERGELNKEAAYDVAVMIKHDFRKGCPGGAVDGRNL